MGPDLLVTLGVLAAAVLLLLSNRLRPDLVALLAVVVLGTSGVLTSEETFSGFSRSAVITLLAIFILAEGLQRTGVTAWVGEWIARAGGQREGRLVAVVMLAGATLSLVMNNIAAAAVLLPGVSAAARRSHVSPSRVLIPLAFGTLLGGMATLLTTTNIVVSSLLRDENLGGFGLFDFAPVGLPLVACGILYMMLVGRRRLPTLPAARERLPPPRPADDLVDLYGLERRLFRARVPAGSRLIDRPLAESTLREIYGLNLVALERGGEVTQSPRPTQLIAEGDVLHFQGDLEEFRRRDVEPYLEILPPRRWREVDLESPGTVVVEAVLAPRSGLVGKTLREVHFRSKYGMNVLAVWRAEEAVVDDLSDLPLLFGDALLLQGPRHLLGVLRGEPDLLLLAPDEEEPPPSPRRWVAVGIAAVTLAVAAAGPFPIGEVMLAGALAMVLTGVLSMDQAYRAVEWPTIFLVAGMLPLGIALSKSGAAALLAHGLLALVGPAGPLALMAALVVATVLLVTVVNSPSVAAIMAPIAITAAQQMGADPRGVAMAVALATSMAFASPLGHPVNLLVMGSGGYRFSDYWRVGWPLVVLLIVLVMVLVPLIWPLHSG
jgi:di/tricarboxylate transporter